MTRVVQCASVLGLVMLTLTACPAQTPKPGSDGWHSQKIHQSFWGYTALPLVVGVLLFAVGVWLGMRGHRAWRQRHST